MIWLALLAVVGLILCFVPLLDLLGYEYSLILAGLGSLASGHIAAAYPQRIREQLAPFPGARFTIARLWLVNSAYGLSLLVVPLLLISANALRVRNCDYVEGLGFFLLGPLLAVLAAAAWGLAAGLITPGQRSASILWITFWVAMIGLELYDGWSTPSVRSLGTFHGYFSGVLYDEDVTIPPALLTLRLRDLLEVTALLFVCNWLIDRSELRLSFKAARTQKKAMPAAALLALAAVVAGLAAPSLGHRRTSADVAEALGGRTVHGRCVLIHPESVEADDAELMARDCAFRLHQIEEFFGIRYEGELTVFLFLNPEQKQELMGAGRTSIAKPWRREVYIQGVRFPHSILKHEIAHVVAGEFGAEPLRVAGKLGGVWAAPGLIEGAAVAAAWSGQELTPHAWSRAMHDLDAAPPMADVMSLRFLGMNASRAYVLAGSFSRFLIEDRGPALYRKAYRTADVEGTYGASLADLEADWLQFLRTVELRPGDLELARERFDRPALFAKVCAHEVAQLRGRADRCENRRDWQEALALRRQVERHSGGDGRSRLELARTLLSADDGRSAAQLLKAIAADEAVRPGLRRAARHLRADSEWSAGRRETALGLFRQLSEEPLTEGAQRLLTVKLAGLQNERAEPFLRRFLLGGEAAFGGEEPDLALLTLSELVAELPDLAIAHYLLGRQLWNRDRFERALPYLQRADRLSLPSEALRAENRRLIAVCHFRLGRLDAARELFQSLADDDSRPSGARAEARDWVERCDWERATARRDGA